MPCWGLPCSPLGIRGTAAVSAHMKRGRQLRGKKEQMKIPVFSVTCGYKRACLQVGVEFRS